MAYLHHEVRTKAEVEGGRVEEGFVEGGDHALVTTKALNFVVVQDHKFKRVSLVVPLYLRPTSSDTGMDETLRCAQACAVGPVFNAPFL